MNRKLKAVIAFLLAVITAFSAPAFAMAAVTTTSKYTGKVYTHNSKLQGYEVYNVIDVSSHNGSNIDWAKVKQDGVDYAIIRVGFTGYTKSKHSLNYDTYYKQNITGALSAGIPVGVYWYSQALNESEAKAEANYLLSAIKGYDIGLPVYYDYEFAGTSDGRLDSAWSTGALNKTKMTANTRAFCETVKAAGYTAGVYANASFLNTNIDGASLALSYPVWLAHYTTQTNYTGDYNMWQYTDSGKVNGVSGSVDCNFLYDIKKVTGLYTAGRGDAGTRIRLAWDAVNGATEYKIYQNIDNEYKYIGSSNTTEYNVTGLNPSWEYYFKVSAVVNGKETVMSDELHTAAACAPVPDLTAKVVSDNQISLTWTDGVCHGYYIEWSTDPSFKTGAQGISVSGSATNSRTITVNGNAENYYVRIRAWRVWNDGYIYGDFSDGVKATKPIKVTGLYAAGRGDGGTRIRLAWDAVEGATEYKIYQNIDHEYRYIGSSETTEFNVTELNPSWEYYFKVTAVVNGKESEMSDELHTVAACAPVPDLTAKVVSDNQISLTWTDGVCHGYYIEWSTDSTFKTGTQGEYVSGSATNSRTITVNGNSEDYYVRIRAWRYWQDGYTFGDFSYGVKATKPIKVTGLYAAGRGDGGTRIRLAWDAVDGATKYNIYQNIDYKYQLIGTSTTTEFNVTELHPSWEYYFKVTAVVNGKECEMSDELHTVAACAPVPDLTAKVVSDNQISLTWTDGVCHGYYIQWSTDPTFETGTQGEYVSGSATNSRTITVNGNAEDYYVRIRAWRYWQDGYTYGDFSEGVKAVNA